MSTELKKCPFCGGELQTLGENHYYVHPTNGCILQHLCFEVDDKQAIEAWNTRKPIDKVVEQLEELSKYEVVENKFRKAIEIVKGENNG